MRTDTFTKSVCNQPHNHLEWVMVINKGAVLSLVLTALSFTSSLQAAPALNAVRQGNNLSLNWSLDDPTYTLECATDLGSTNWTPPPNTSIANGAYTFNDTATNTSRFYRLRKPACATNLPPIPVVTW